MTGKVELSREAIREMLTERKLFVSLADNLEFDTEFVMDSLSLVWFITGLEERCGIKVDVDFDPQAFTSINAIYTYLRSCLEVKNAEVNVDHVEA